MRMDRKELANQISKSQTLRKEGAATTLTNLDQLEQFMNSRGAKNPKEAAFMHDGILKIRKSIEALAKLLESSEKNAEVSVVHLTKLRNLVIDIEEKLTSINYMVKEKILNSEFQHAQDKYLGECLKYSKTIKNMKDDHPMAAKRNELNERLDLLDTQHSQFLPTLKQASNFRNMLLDHNAIPPAMSDQMVTEIQSMTAQFNDMTTQLEEFNTAHAASAQQVSSPKMT